MSMKYDFSVIVLCYNPNMDKLKNTLYSIMRQKSVTFEIVIADDGSKEEYSTELREWFAQHEFADYKLVMNEQNQGTVKNLLSALQVVEGRYTKNISPGDYLYDEDTLKAYFACMEKENLSVCFGKAAYYSIEDGRTTIYNRQSPIDLEVYRKKDKKKIRRNYFWFRDYALGACFAFEAEAARKYTAQISEYVRYAEDTAVICMISAGENIGLLDQFAVWYEYGTGISTAASSKWSNIILEENRNVFHMLAERDKLAEKTYKYHFGRKCKNRYWDTIRKIVFYPPYLIFMIKALGGTHFHKECLLCDKEELETIVANIGKR